MSVTYWTIKITFTDDFTDEQLEAFEEALDAAIKKHDAGATYTAEREEVEEAGDGET